MIKKSLLSILAFNLLVLSQVAFADTLCAKKTVSLNRRGQVPFAASIRRSAGACPRGTQAIVDTSVFTGPAGATGAAGTNGTNGAPGADGSLRIYGDGSAGAFNPPTGSVFLDQSNLQFTDVDIPFGTTLTVSSGTVIRCTGTFTNNGTIEVSPYAGGAATFFSGANNPSSPNLISAGSGIAINAGGSGDYSVSTLALGGSGGSAFGSIPLARSILNPGPLGGSGGGSGGTTGARGGGTLTVLCNGAITNASTGGISAQGQSSGGAGSGGGGGGIVILASKTSVTTSLGSFISVTGGDGGPSFNRGGAGGGGGGGIVHYLAPSISIGAVTLVDGGAAGSNAVAITNPNRMGGGGGGSLYGNGGNGGDVAAGGAASAAIDGVVGISLQTLVDPTALF